MASSAPPSKVSGDGGGGGGGLPPVALAAAVGGAALAAYVTMKQPPSAATINSNNMFLQGNYAPVTKEIHVTAQTAATARTDSTNSSSSSSPPGLEVIAGSIPADLRGAYVRVGPNPQFKPQAHHHWFDGSGMVHGVCISDAKVKATSDGSGSGSGSGSGTGTGATDSGKPNSVNLSYANHYVRTHRFLEARRVGQDAAIGMGSLLGFYGLVNMAKFAFKVATKRYRKGPAAGSRADDTAPSNTALVFHDRRLLALVEIAAPFALKLAKDGHFESLGVYHYGGQLRHPFTAHPKIDPETGEMVFFGYSMFTKPYMSYGVVSQAGDMVTHFDVPLPAGTFVHDFGITKNYSILMDLPMGTQFSGMLTGKFWFGEKDRPTRFGVVPRHAASAKEVQWFEATKCFIFHTMNAWEEVDSDGNTVVCLVAVRYTKLWLEFGLGLGPDMKPVASSDHTDANMLAGELYEWRFNLGTGSTTERVLPGCSHVFGEFPSVADSKVGRPAQFGYMSTTVKDSMRPTSIDGCVKVDLMDEGKVVGAIKYGGRRCGGEPVFVAREGGTAEDDGYLITFVHDEAQVDTATATTEMWIMDAKTMGATPLAIINMPQRVPYGFHGLWLTEEQLASQREVDDAPIKLTSKL